MSAHSKTPREIPLTPASRPEAARAPRAFDLDGEAEGNGAHGKVEFHEPETPAPFETEAVNPKTEKPPALFTLSSLFWAAVSLLVTLYLADAIWSFILSLESKAPWVGQAAMGLVGIVVLGLVAFLLREMFSLFRLRKVTMFRVRAEAMDAKPEARAVRALVEDLRDFYARDPASAAARAEIDRLLGEIHDPRTLLGIAERTLLKGKDDAARATIAAAAQRVSVVTALSPRAIVDILFVLMQGVALIRQLSAIYGGRASGFGLLRLTGRVVSHLAITGGVAMADSVVSQFLGAGLAARLSAKFGEGVLNGILTGRVGIAAIDLCRPLPYLDCIPVKLSEVVKSTITLDKVAENPAA